MALPVFRRFSQADVPTAPNWINAIFNPLNVFCEQTVQALNKNLVIGENVQGMKFSTTFTPNALTSEIIPIKFNYTSGGTPTCCIIGQISRVDNVLMNPASPVAITNWSLNSNTSPPTIIIKSIGGLSANVAYNLTVLVL